MTWLILLTLWLSVPVSAAAYFIYVDYFGPPTADYERVPPLLAFGLALGWPIYALATAAWMLFSLFCSWLYD